MNVKSIAIIGAGTIGRGIAYAAALGGYATVLEDISPRILEHAIAWVRQAFEAGVARGEVQAKSRERALSLITTAGIVEEAIRDAELIIETVPDELEMKLELFTIFDKFAKTGTIFASSTSSLSIADFTDVTVSRDRCIGMRFFNPVPKMDLVELVRTAYTSAETVATCREVARRIAKEVVVADESSRRSVYDYTQKKAAEQKA